ncbi:hypothetical protein JXL83_09310 [candidate division WOR-3 bacterium]|nr:hypothetical protein [candidate division WOR-3 bacterium]
MKKILLLVIAVASLAVFGCTKDDSPTNPGGGTAAAPTNVAIDATMDGMGLVITWYAVTNADSYQIEYPGTKGYAVVTGTSYTHNNPTELGSYRVRTFVDNDTSTWSSSVTTNPVEQSGFHIGEWTHSSYLSCFYWDNSGNGYLMSSQATGNPPYNASLIDIFLYDNNTSNNLYFVGGQTSPSTGTKTTYLASDVNGTYTHFAPPTGLNPPAWAAITQIPLNTTNYFWVELSNGHYVRILVTSLNTKDLYFRYWWQPVQGFRGAF